MKIYCILTLAIIIGFSVIQMPIGYSSNSQNNSFSYYEKSCNNDSCVITTCEEDKSCQTTGERNNIANNTLSQLSNQDSINEKALDFAKMWKNFLEFDN